jgi:hypothetical protein
MQTEIKKLFPTISPEGAKGPQYSVSTPICQDLSDLLNFIYLLTYQAFLVKFHEFERHYCLMLNTPPQFGILNMQDHFVWEDGEELNIAQIQERWNKAVTCLNNEYHAVKRKAFIKRHDRINDVETAVSDAIAAVVLKHKDSIQYEDIQAGVLKVLTTLSTEQIKDQIEKSLTGSGSIS